MSKFPRWRQLDPHTYERVLGIIRMRIARQPDDRWAWEVYTPMGRHGQRLIFRRSPTFADTYPEPGKAKREAERVARDLLAPAFATLATPTPTELPQPTTEKQ